MTYVPGNRCVAELRHYQRAAPKLPHEEEEPLKLPFDLNEGEEAEPQELAKEILRENGDKHSWPFYQRVARYAVEQPRLRTLVYRVLSEVKDEDQQGLIDTSRGAVFTDKLKRYCEQDGIELGLHSSEEP